MPKYEENHFKNEKKIPRDDMCLQADQNTFTKVLRGSDHVVHRLLPPVSIILHGYSVRPGVHGRVLPACLSAMLLIPNILYTLRQFRNCVNVKSFSSTRYNNIII